MQEKKLGILTSTVEMEKKSEHHTAGYHLEYRNQSSPVASSALGKHLSQ